MCIEVPLGCFPKPGAKDFQRSTSASFISHLVMFDHVCPCIRLQSDNSVFVCLLLGVTSSNFSLLVYLIVGISMCLYSY